MARCEGRAQTRFALLNLSSVVWMLVLVLVLLLVLVEKKAMRTGVVRPAWARMVLFRSVGPVGRKVWVKKGSKELGGGDDRERHEDRVRGVEGEVRFRSVGFLVVRLGGSRRGKEGGPRTGELQAAVTEDVGVFVGVLGTGGRWVVDCVGEGIADAACMRAVKGETGHSTGLRLDSGFQVGDTRWREDVTAIAWVFDTRLVW